MDNKIKLREGMSWEEKKRAADLALYLGFHSVSASFPVTSSDAGMEVPKSHNDFPKLKPVGVKAAPKNYEAASDHPGVIPDFDWRKKKGLETIFSKGFFLKDDNQDGLPDRLNFKISFPKDSGADMMTAVCNTVFRFGMETTAYEGSITATEAYEGNRIIFEYSDECGMRFEECDGAQYVYIYGRGEELELFSSVICEKFTSLQDGNDWISQLQCITDSLAMQNLDGQLAYLKAFADGQKDVKVLGAPEITFEHDRLTEAFPDVEFMSYKDRRLVYEKEYDIPWETDEFRRIYAEEIIPLLKENDKVEVYGALSEEADVRQELNRAIETMTLQKGASLYKSEIICAYKQGLSWIQEVILPNVAEDNHIDKAEIAFRPFLPKGETLWNDEDGATPSYNNVGGQDPDRWYDLPIRHLQELYPVGDIIAEQLHISQDNLKFVPYEEDGDATYCFRTYDKDGRVISEDKYTTWCSERPYLDAYPGLGKVHPDTGYIKVAINGHTVLKQRICTDIERIWDIYQSEVLPDCRLFAEQKTNQHICTEEQPFFSMLSVEAAVSEPDYRLSSREDIISTLDGLHEDIYFAGADYFKNYGMEKAGEVLDAPGLILPMIRKKDGKPYMKVTLYDSIAKEPVIIAEERTIKGLAKRTEIGLFIEKIKLKDGRFSTYLNVECPSEQIVAMYSELMSEGIISVCSAFGDCDSIVFRCGERIVEAPAARYSAETKHLTIHDIELYEHTLIGYDQYLEVIEKLRHVQGITIMKTASSYQGRSVYAIELLPDDKGYVSRTKRLTYLPSEVINARHHANEVSGTNAAFMLLKELLTNPIYKTLPQKLNLVIIPMENTDGTAIHYELQKENPYWKYHVARFNAIGKEFYHEHFKPDTIHTEAMGLTRIWEKYLPDVIVDNHGVPSHEWDQQFSGYTSPSFKGFWLPRSLLYGYFWMVSDEKYKANYPVNKKMEDVIAEAIGGQEDMRSWNREWMKQFETYAHAWMPKLFPADYYKEMINYWIPFAHDPGHRYPSIRFPWITTVAYTSEVADETAQGDYLNLCARAHVVHDLAIIDMLLKAECVIDYKCLESRERISVRCTRKRPLVVGDM